MAVIVAAVTTIAVLVPLAGQSPAATAPRQIVTETFDSAPANLAPFTGTWRTSKGWYRKAPGPGLSASTASFGATNWRLATTVRPLRGSDREASIIFSFTSPDDYSYVHLDRHASRSGIYLVSNGQRDRVRKLSATWDKNKAYRVALRQRDGVLSVSMAPKGRSLSVVASRRNTSPLGVGLGAWRSPVAFDKLVVTGATSTPTDEDPPEEPLPPFVPNRTVNVTTSDELTAALADARPGDLIQLADGTYTTKGTAAPSPVGDKTYVGTFVLAKSGTAENPIVVRGSRDAVIDGKPGDDGTGTQYGFYLIDADYTRIEGLTVTNVAKGIVADRSSNSRIQGVLVHTVGQEGIHLRSFSSDNVVKDNVVRLTGMKNSTYGEGIYVGSANSNWGTYSGGEPDASDRNLILDNDISQTGAESMDIKEGTTGGTIMGNTFDGATMTGSWADSWIDLKGNSWLVTQNVGSNALLDGFQIHGALSGWGNNNVLKDNTAAVNADGYGFWLQNNVSGNLISCDNAVSGAELGFANVACAD
ncbi:MAG: NosD domain-containing protein [Nocardioides sp.]